MGKATIWRARLSIKLCCSSHSACCAENSIQKRCHSMATLRSSSFNQRPLQATDQRKIQVRCYETNLMCTDRSSIVHTRARRGPAAVPAVIPPSNIEKAHGTLLTPPTAANAGGGQRCVSSPHDTAHLRSLCHSLSSAARSTYAPHRSSEPIAAPHPTVARNVCSCCCSEPSAACRSASSASSPIT